MTLINTTFYVDTSVENEFLDWVRSTYVPSAMDTDGFRRPVFTRLLLEPQEGMTGYAVQVTAPGTDAATRWHDGCACELRTALTARFGHKVLFFTTYMEEIEL